MMNLITSMQAQHCYLVSEKYMIFEGGKNIEIKEHGHQVISESEQMKHFLEC